jgi:hypothetical protein
MRRRPAFSFASAAAVPGGGQGHAGNEGARPFVAGKLVPVSLPECCQCCHTANTANTALTAMTANTIMTVAGVRDK